MGNPASPPHAVTFHCAALAVLSVVLVSACQTVPESPQVPTSTATQTTGRQGQGQAPWLEPPAVLPEHDADMAPASPPSLLTPSLGEEVALRALALLGKPYRYGGADLEGFDCSGLVFFIHQELGFEVPRTAAAQQSRAQRVERLLLQPGDLLFFRTTRSKRISHVGIYVGERRFVHAPQSGKAIELRDMDDEYYSKRLVFTGRLRPAS